MGRTIVVQPIPHGLVDVLNQQDGLYTLLLRGLIGGQIREEKQDNYIRQQGHQPL